MLFHGNSQTCIHWTSYKYGIQVLVLILWPSQERIFIIMRSQQCYLIDLNSVCSLQTLIITFGNLPILIIILKRPLCQQRASSHLDLCSSQNKWVKAFILKRIFWVRAWLTLPSFILQFNCAPQRKIFIIRMQSITMLQRTNSLVYTAQEKSGWKCVTSEGSTNVTASEGNSATPSPAGFYKQDDLIN